MSAKEAILRCARDLYVEHGLTGMSLRAVAECAGVSAPAIYRHFDGKEDLLWAVALQGHQIFARYLGRGLRGVDARERLSLTGLGYLDFAMDHRAFYLIMFVAPPEHLGWEKLARRSNDEAGATFQMLVDRVRECQDAGVLSPGDPDEHAISIWAHVHGMVSLYYRLPPDPEARRLAAPEAVSTDERFRALYQRSVDALVAGLAPG